MKELNGGKQMKDVWSDIWTGTLTPQREKLFGKHPTQKPLYLLEKIILASTREDDLILDPFCGSGTTGVVCKKWGRKFIGIDITEEFVALSKERLIHTQWRSAISTTGSKRLLHGLCQSLRERRAVETANLSFEFAGRLKKYRVGI